MSTGLGGATFQVRADPTQFQAGMKRAKEEATRSSQQIGAAVKQIGDDTFLSLAKANRSIANANKAFQDLSKTVGGGKGGHLGLGLMALGNLADDLQYGFRSIVNNIPQVVYLMGGSAGLAGGAAVAAVAINQLVNRWDGLVDSMQSRWLNVAASDLEKLRLATAKAGEEFDTLMKTPSELGAREISKLKEAITDLQAGGGAGLFKGIAQAVALEPGMRAEETPAQKAQREATENIMKVAQAAGDEKLAQQMARDIKKMNDTLMDFNNNVAKTLIGKSLAAGEEGTGARAQLKRLIEKYSDSFSPAFRAAMQRNTPEMLQGEIDLENAKKARERARGVAGQLLGSPLGTQLMLGGAGGGPASAAAIAAMMAPSRRRFGPLANDMIKKMTDAGLTEDQARQVLGGMGPTASYNRGRKISEKLGVPLGPGGVLDNRVVGQAIKELFAEGMKAVVGKPTGLLADIGKALKAAGVIGQEPKEVLTEMQAQLADRKRTLMLERGMNAKQAEMTILREQQQRAFGDQMRPAQWVSGVQLAKMSAVNALNGGNDIAKRSLNELIAIRRALAMMRGQRIMEAVAAGPP
jgi:hypothetical protein